MQKQEFGRITRIGLGRAIIVLQENDPRPFGGVILDACLHNQNYDSQCEGSRSKYIWDLIQLSGDRSYYRSAVLTALEATPVGADLDQLFELAHGFAVEGDDKARAAMYARFAANSFDLSLDASDLSVLTAAAEEIISLDGIAGFLFVAEKLGERALADPNMWATDYERTLLERKVGAEQARRAIEQTSQRNERIAAYIKLVDEGIKEREQAKAAPRIVGGPSLAGWAGPMGRVIAEQATQRDQVDIERAAHDLIIEQDSDRVLAYLRVFRNGPVPLDPEALIALGQHHNSSIGRAALLALSNIQHPKVRELALEMLSSPPHVNSDMGVSLLKRNYMFGDHSLIAQRLAAEHDLHIYHLIGSRALDVFKANQSPECADVLTTLYENGPCTNCRENCVDLLHALTKMPKWMMRECQYDANQNLRVKARSWLSGNEQ